MITIQNSYFFTTYLDSKKIFEKMPVFLVL
jgi:hypothetical protein